MSVSGSEYVRRIKAQIEEIDPSAVRELAGEGVALIDVRESGEWDSGHLPGRQARPARLSRVAHRRRRSPIARST